MKIFIDNKEFEIHDNATVAQALALVDNLPKGGFAVAIGSDVVTRDKWDSATLAEGTKITIFKAFFGG